MSEDFTQKLPTSGTGSEILTAIKDLDTKVTRIDIRVQSLEQKFDGLDRKVDSLDRKVDGLEKKVDERLHDTRPIWHKVIADIAQLQAGQERLEQGQLAMRNDVSNVSRDQIVINDSLRKIHLDFHTIDDRLYKLEVHRKPQNSST